MPDYLDGASWQLHAGSKAGTIGMPLPGTCFRVVDPDTLASLPAGNDGLILIGGVQVMQGYLDEPARAGAAIAELDGRRWYRTGDKGHLDEDGFLTVADRYSHFARLGGEMVSLGAVEQVLAAALGDDEFEVVVVALPDEKKGEQLVALVPRTAMPLDPAQLRARLLEAGVGPLMIPSLWFEVEALPKLGSDKADFAAAKTLAQSELAAAVPA